MIEGGKEARTKRKQSIKLGEFLCYKLLFFGDVHCDWNADRMNSQQRKQNRGLYSKLKNIRVGEFFPAGRARARGRNVFGLVSVQRALVLRQKCESFATRDVRAWLFIRLKHA